MNLRIRSALAITVGLTGWLVAGPVRVGAENPPPPPTVFVQDNRLDTIDVGDDTSSVSATQTFPGVPACSSPTHGGQESGCRMWHFNMFNGAPAPVGGAQVGVDNSASGLNLNDPTQFDFRYTQQNGGFGSPPSTQPCPAHTSSSVTCPVPGVTLAAPGGSLDVNTSPDPQFGVPISPAPATGFDSSRSVAAPDASGVAAVTVDVALQDTSRFGLPGTSTNISVGTFNSNEVSGSEVVTGPGGTVLLPCAGFGSAPCVQVNEGTCTATFCGGGQICTDVQMSVRNAVVAAPYQFSFRDHVAHSDLPAAGNCGSVKPALRISAQTMSMSVGSPTCCSAVIADPTLGNVTFSIDSSNQGVQLQPGTVVESVVQYEAERQLQVQAGSPQCGGLPISGPIATFRDDGSSAAPASDYTATIDWGDGTSSAGAVSGPTGGPYAVSGGHSYSIPGPFVVTVTVTDVDTPWNSDAATMRVLGTFASGGAFVVGDRSDTGSVTFWSNQWAQANALSGGPAPSAFKGFVARPPACGGPTSAGWSTSPGNSASPPASVPGYMLVLVTSHVVQSGDVISGNVVGLLLVRVDPGYGGNPGHPGTGTVVPGV